MQSISQKKTASNFSKLEKIGQSFFPAAYINDTDEGIKSLERLIKDYKVGGLTFFHSRASTATNFEGKKAVVRNDDSAKRLAELIVHYQSIASHPLLISIDAEWGLAMRVENTPQYPYAITLGAIPNEQNELIFEVGKQMGFELKSMGVHLNLAPVVDVNINPNNPVIGYRAFGENKEHITQKALALYKGLKSAGILGCFKHFPGHGDTAVDSHLGLPIISKSKNEIYDQELFPFIQAIKSGIDSILIGHLAVPSLTSGKNISATLSKEIIKGILREELGFEGVVISDALNMHSVSKQYTEKGLLEWKAFDAGNDILCFAEHVEEGILKIDRNANIQQIEESFSRIQKLKETINVEQPIKPIFEFKNTTSLNTKLAKASLTHYKSSPKEFNKYKTQDFEVIVIGNSIDCTFIQEVEKIKSFTVIDYTENVVKNITSNNIVIALFPPLIKPTNQFGLDDNIVKNIAHLSKTNNVCIYLFGNPYSLRVLETENINNIILIYQDFNPFQQIAAKHFLGQHIASGKIPVELSK